VACQARARTASAHRLPCARILTFNEGHGDARWLLTRLSPLHHDPAVSYTRAIPSLASLTKEQMSELLANMIPTDTPSFQQYYHSLFNKI
jgi:hypothetical protein